MFCTQCGFQLEDEDLFCAKCGKPTKAGYTAPVTREPRRLVRVMEDKKIAGVCSGFARYFDVDVTFMRVIWLLIAILSGGLGIIAYLLAWIVMPRDVPRPEAEQPRPVVQNG